MFEDVDWAHGGQHMWEQHQVTPDQANEALRDPSRIMIEPDYASKSGRTVRVIGYSRSLGDLISVIVIGDGQVQYGVYGWKSNDKDRRIYREEQPS